MIGRLEPADLDAVRTALEDLTVSDPAKALALIHENLWKTAGEPAIVFRTNAVLSKALRAGPSIEPVALGVRMGELKGGRFRWALEGARWAAGLAGARTVRLDERFSAKFLYGRDVPAPRRVGPPHASGVTLYVVKDRVGSFLGVGRLGSKAVPARILENLIDLGWYLREGG